MFVKTKQQQCARVPKGAPQQLLMVWFKHAFL